MATLEVQTVIYLRARINALQRETPVTAAGRAMLHATIMELEAQIVAVRNGLISNNSGRSTLSVGLV